MGKFKPKSGPSAAEIAAEEEKKAEAENLASIRAEEEKRRRSRLQQDEDQPDEITRKKLFGQ
jgi:hypothetical protein